MARCHFPAGSQVNSKIYHFVFWTLNCPPAALAVPTNILRPSWALLTVAYVGVL